MYLKAALIPATVRTLIMITVSEREGCGALSEVDDNVRGRQSAKRGGKNSRARRREKYLESQAACGACWVQLVRGALRQRRAAARASALAAVEHLRSARAKIRAAVWRRWTRRPDVYSECGLCCAYRDTALAPLSLDEWLLKRDEWLLKRASALARHLPEDEFYAYRHVLDWLRVDLKMDGEVLPYWCHTLYAEAQQEESAANTRPTRTTPARPTRTTSSTNATSRAPPSALTRARTPSAGGMRSCRAAAARLLSLAENFTRSREPLLVCAGHERCGSHMTMTMTNYDYGVTWLAWLR